MNSSDKKIQTLSDLKDLRYQLVGLRRDKSLPIYIVDANFILKKLIKNLLTQMGFVNVEINLNAMRTLEALRSASEPTLVMYSITNEELDGIKFIRKFNEFKKDKPVKIIFISNPLSVSEMEKIGELGVHGFLFKPVEFKGLLQTLQISDLW